MSTQAQKLAHSQKSFTPLVALQIFSAGLIFTVAILSLFILFLKAFYDFEPSAGAIYFSPVYAVAAAGACLALSFLIPEFLMDSARKDLKQEGSREQTEDLPFILVPTIFIRFSLLAIVTIIGFIMAFAGQGISVFLPFAFVSVALMVAYFPTEHRMKTWLQAH
jgi:hypothetical protein